MSISFRRSVDIEDVVRRALKDHLAAYCKPLPAGFSLPCVEITQVGGTDQEGQIDTFDITMDARAEEAADASETLRTAIGLLRAVAKNQSTEIRHIEVNSSGAWGSDPVRPDLSMYSARLRVVAHMEQITI